MKTPIDKFVKNRQTGNGVQRVIDNEGTIVNEQYNSDSGISVDWISAEWLEKEG